MTDGQIDKIENIIGYKFRNKTLLVNAFTHVSYINEHKNCESYEKLEFLGDSILNFIVADKLYHAQLRDEGEMTMLRARMVSRSPLAEAVKRMDLCPFVRLGKGAEKCDTMPVKIQSDIFESVLAAIYLDSGSMTEAKTFVDTIYHLTRHSVIITDTDKVIAMAGVEKELLDQKPISEHTIKQKT